MQEKNVQYATLFLLEKAVSDVLVYSTSVILQQDV